MEIYDFVIIGGGSAGYAAAEQAHRRGLRIAVIQGSQKFGGLCIQNGCMPSKALLESANRFRELGEAHEFGLNPGGKPTFSAPEIIARKRRFVDEFAVDRRKEMEHGGFDLMLGRARFIDANTVEVAPLGEGGLTRQIHARTTLIATGSRIKMLPLPGLEETGVLTSDKVLDADHIPRSVIVLGAGPVGLEAAHYYSSLGTDVTVLNSAEHILGSVDFDVSTALMRSMENRGTKFFCGAKVISLSREDKHRKSVRFEFKGEERSVEAAEIIYAIGREPCSDLLGLENADIEVDKNQHIQTRATQQTSCPHIFAAGDVAGPYEILHLAVRQGEVAARNAARFLQRLDGEMEQMDYRLKLQAVFTEPEVAAVGMNEKEVVEAKRAFHAVSFPFNDHGRAIIEGTTDGFAKLIAEQGTGELLGAAVVGPRGAELIHEIVAVMYYHGTVNDLLVMPHYHPTLSEVWRSVAQKWVEEG